MTIQQLRAQIAALQDATMDENRNFRSAYDEGKFDALSAVDALLDSSQEEPQVKKLAGLQHVNETCKENGNSLTQESVSEFPNTESMIESYKQRLISQANGVKNSPLIDMCLASYKHGINETLDTLNLSNVQRTLKNWEKPKFKVGDRIKIKGIHNEDVTRVITDIKEGEGVGFSYFFADGSISSIGDDRIKLVEEPVSEDLEEAAKSYSNNLDNICGSIGKQTRNAFKAGAKWQREKDESCSNDLGEYINELSKQFPEVSFAKLSRIAVRVSKWQKANLWKPADGNDLPEIDREVIAILDNGKVVFAHRPPEYWYGKNIITGKVTRYYPKTYDKGGWNIPNIKYWLDCLMPKEIEL